MLQSDWSEPILGKYEGLPWQSVLEMLSRSGVIPMDFVIYMNHADQFAFEGAFVILFPQGQD